MPLYSLLPHIQRGVPIVRFPHVTMQKSQFEARFYPFTLTYNVNKAIFRSRGDILSIVTKA
jgi:hypothetical protein